jgi:hypothetical protein
MSKRGEVLVAIINNKLDFAILREQLWYRIPVSGAEKGIRSGGLQNGWPFIRRSPLAQKNTP